MVDFPEWNISFNLKTTTTKKKTDFASKHIDEDFHFWKTVVFTYDSKFNIFGCDRYWKLMKSAEMKSENFIPTVKHGGSM